MTQVTESAPPAYISKPQLLESRQDRNIFYFTLADVDTSVANSLCRLISMDIPCVAIPTFPDKNNQVDIRVNTTRHTNEILKHRIGCIPIHISDLSVPLENLRVEVDRRNDSEAIEYVTTDNFRIVNKNTETELDKDEVRRIFPHDEITDEPILLARLRPRIRQEGKGEELSFSATLSISNANESGRFTQASTSSYGMTVDKDRQEQEWDKELARLEEESSKQGIPMSDEQKEFEKQNWLLGKGKRITIPNHFDMRVETIGVYSNEELVRLACKVMLDKLSNIERLIQQHSLKISEFKGGLRYGFEITLENENYTLGKVLEYAMYELYYRGRIQKVISYIGFYKEHPHDTFSILRIGFREETNQEQLIQYIIVALDELKKLYSSLNDLV
jgi:DNA-directed RNA polymerase subunit L